MVLGTKKGIKMTSKLKKIINKLFCRWIFISNNTDECYETECGETFSFIIGDVKNNKYIYCPGCGRKIKVKYENE